MAFRRFSLTVILALLALPLPALASGQCYSPADLQAEQLLRLHSELMVITYACKQGSRGQDLETYYNGFTRNNIGILRDAEQTLIRHYKADFHDNGIAHLDDLRTRLGNEVGQEMADESAPLFCKAFRDKVILLFYDDPRQLQGEVQRMILTEKSFGHLCKLASAAVPGADMDKRSR